MKKWLWLAILCMMASAALAINPTKLPFTPSQPKLDRAPTQQQPLSSDRAFQFSAMAKDNQTVLLRWKMAPGYYLYRDQIQFCPQDPSHTRLGQPIFPKAVQKQIPTLGTVAIYEKTLTIPVPIISHVDHVLRLKVNYQGCSQSGYCYPPITKLVQLDLSKNYLQPQSGTPVTADNNIPNSKSRNRLDRLLNASHPLMVLLTFFGFGVLISFTPCVLPMVPILSGIIVGHKKITHWHAFLLSLCYVLGMAVTYAIAGLLFGYLGGTLQAIMQQPWIIAAFSLLFVALALSLFGLYDIRLPARLHNKFTKMSEHQKHGTYLGVFLMGALSTLILSPCVTAPLVAVLSYISQSGHALFGGLALFIMGLGMGLPLLVIGATSSRVLPKAGPWMHQIEVLMGVLLLAVAIFMLSRVIPYSLGMVLWVSLLLGYSIYLGAFASVSDHVTITRKTIGIGLFVYSLLLGVGVLVGTSNPWFPWRLMQRLDIKAALPFQAVRNYDDVKRILAKPANQGKPALLDFYADWCVSCRVLETQVFANQHVKRRLQDFVLLRADITANDAQNKALMRQFNVIAPPTIIIFNAKHQPMPSKRIIGEISATEFLQNLDQL